MATGLFYFPRIYSVEREMAKYPVLAIHTTLALSVELSHLEIPKAVMPEVKEKKDFTQMSNLSKGLGSMRTYLSYVRRLLWDREHLYGTGESPYQILTYDKLRESMLLKFLH